MPCRALEAFGPNGVSLATISNKYVLMPCRALEAFRRSPAPSRRQRKLLGLNALSGIGGVQTYHCHLRQRLGQGVLMPCRALEAFRPLLKPKRTTPGSWGLNALSGIGGVQT